MTIPASAAAFVLLLGLVIAYWGAVGLGLFVTSDER